MIQRREVNMLKDRLKSQKEEKKKSQKDLEKLQTQPKTNQIKWNGNNLSSTNPFKSTRKGNHGFTGY